MATSTKPKHLCCMHPQQRIDSPEPPPRPLASIDGIFAAAALPEDHPHALHLPGLRDKKPELDLAIVRSPGLGEKLKMQFRRKSVRSLGRERGYDDDATALTSREVLVGLQAVPGSERSWSGGSEGKVQPPLAVTTVCGGGGDQSRCASDTGSKAEIRSSLLGSAEYLRPIIEQ